MDLEDLNHLEKLLKKYRGNLRILEQQEADYGSIGVPIHIQNSITQVKEKIADIESQLERRYSGRTIESPNHSRAVIHTTPSRKKGFSIPLPRKLFVVISVFILLIIIVLLFKTRTPAPSNLSNNNNSTPINGTGFSGIIAPKTSTATVLSAQYDVRSGFIVFEAKLDGNWDIFLVNLANTSVALRLTTSEKSDRTPSVSPDGSRIAFVSYRNGDQGDIYIMNYDGTQQTAVTNTPQEESSPRWSPDGKQLVFASERDGNWDVFSLKLESSDEANWINLTESSPSIDTNPDWSINDAIVYASEGDNDCPVRRLYTIKSDGSGKSLAINDCFDQRFPSWSPDGQNIAFQSDKDGDEDIYVFNVTSRVIYNVSNNQIPDDFPNWSADGRHLVYCSKPTGGNWQIIMYSLDKKLAIPITSPDNESQNPDWGGL